MYKKAQEVQLTLLSQTYFDIVIFYWGRSALSPSYFFLDRELLFIDFKRGIHTT